MDLNRAMIIGRLTQDPELRTTPQGSAVTSFSVATNFIWTDSAGQKQEKVEFHNIVAWRKLAEICAQYLKKASKVYIEGRLQTRDWEGQDGVKRYRTEIVADNMIMLDRAGAQGGSPAPTYVKPTPVENVGNTVIPTADKSTFVNPISADKSASVDPSVVDRSAFVNPTSADRSADDEIKVEDIPF